LCFGDRVAVLNVRFSERREYELDSFGNSVHKIEKIK
jgi:hypothetical protein